jgi:phage-related protein
MSTGDWVILTYETNRGEKPVDEFIKKQQSQGRSKIVHNVRLLRQYGNMLGMPHSKALGGGLYELRIRGKEELRIFYCFTGQKTIYLLHAFKKQKQQTSHKELELAVSRMRELTRI